ncbi:MAG: hypothetical protein L3J47_10280, partial [Sulfurovum sp.]|nr:hypothetical protein [Sulfurovum sp.]
MSKIPEHNRQSQYARYEDIDKEQLERDINTIKETMEPPSEEDFRHLLKMERWGRAFTFSGYAIILLLTLTEYFYGALSG